MALFYYDLIGFNKVEGLLNNSVIQLFLEVDIKKIFIKEKVLVLSVIKGLRHNLYKYFSIEIN